MFYPLSIYQGNVKKMFAGHINVIVSMSTVREYGTVRRTVWYGTVRYGTVLIVCMSVPYFPQFILLIQTFI